VLFLAFVQAPCVLHLALTEQTRLIFLYDEQKEALYFEEAGTQVAFKHKFHSLELHFVHIEKEPIIRIAHHYLSGLLLMGQQFDNLIDQQVLIREKFGGRFLLMEKLLKLKYFGFKFAVLSIKATLDLSRDELVLEVLREK